jgi:acetoin utilization protein AcuC
MFGSDLLRYDFGSEHPFSPQRGQVTWELCKALGLLEHPEVVLLEPQEATNEDLSLFHEAEFIEFVQQSCERDYGFLDEGDTPARKGGFEATKIVVGSSWRMVEAVAKGEARYGATLIGGLHHAWPGRASGFCIFNDIAICIQKLRRDFGLKRIAYIDIDAHHGEGLMYGFYDDSDVLTIDFHEDGYYLFPGTGNLHEIGRGQAAGTKFNIPMPPQSGDQSFIQAFESLVPDVLYEFRPEFILFEMGVDGHSGDPMTDLNYSAASYKQAIQLVRKLAEQYCGGKLALFAGGGYNLATCAMRWTEMLAVLLDFHLPDYLPEGWRKFYREFTGGAEAPVSFKEEYTLDKTFAQVMENISWFHQKGLIM